MTTLSTLVMTGPQHATDDIKRREFLRVGALSGAGAAIGVALLPGCGVGSERVAAPSAKPPAKPTGRLRFAHMGDPTTFDPTRTGGSLEHPIVWHNLYESLVGFKIGPADDLGGALAESSQLEGVLAERFESSPDAREWTFALKDGIRFHDGEPLTASAVKATLEYYADSPSYWGSLLSKDVEIDDSDPMLVRVTFPSPLPDLARFLTTLKIISPKLIKSGSDVVSTTPAGTGPFRFVSHQTAKSVILEANPEYRGPGPYLERIEFLIIPDADARVAALRSGSVEFVHDVPPANARQLRDDRRIAVTEYQVGQAAKLLFYNKTPPVDNLKIRQALAHAIDRQALVDVILDGVGTVDDSWVTPGMYGHSKPTTTYAYDPERAKQLLAASGIPSPIELVFTVGGGPPWDQLTRAIAGMVEKVGIKADVKSVPGPKIVEATTNPPDAKPWHGGTSYWGDTTGTAGFFANLRLLEQYQQFEDPTWSNLVAKVSATPDGPERVRLFAELDERFAQQLPAINLFAGHLIDAYNKTVRGHAAPKRSYHINFGQVYLAG